MGIRLNTRSWLIACLVVAAAVFGLEQVIEPGVGASLTIAIVVFLGLAEGATVLMAGAELSDGHWHKQLIPSVGALHYLIPVAMLLFIVNIPQLAMYPWIDAHGIWFNKNFYIARHLIVMALMFILCRVFLLNALRGAGIARFWAVILVILFVWHMSMIGIETFMSIERPWFSTLFGAFVMVSAFLSGICTIAIILFGWRRRTDAPARLIQKSIGGLMFGFATFWAYFFFSQLIVIWYGNIPEETHYLVRRVGVHTPYSLPSKLVFIMIWMCPFIVLLSRKNKTRAHVTTALALIMLTGVTMMFWLMLDPVVHVNVPLLAIEMALLALLTASLVRSHGALLPPLAGPVPVEGHHTPAAAKLH